METVSKKSIRQTVRARISSMSEESKVSRSRDVCTKILNNSHIEQAQCIALYCALEDETDLSSLAQALKKSGKKVVIPRVSGLDMDFFQMQEGLMQKGSFGIAEPDPSATPCSESMIDVMIVPGRAFTTSGKRVGRGKGFYDRYISRKAFRAYTIGVCFAEQIFEDLPTEEFDRTLDCVIFQ